MGEEHPTVLVTEASTLHFGPYSRTQRTTRFSHNKTQGYRLVLGAKLQFPTETKKNKKIIMGY